MKEIKIRMATAEDVPFVAECVLAAVDLYDFEGECPGKALAESICAREDTLYSYKHTRIAEVDGKAAGCLVSYDGAIYADSRERTFALFRDTGVEIGTTGIETGPGEYYLDSMAIRPEFRGDGLGHRLLLDAIKEAKEEAEAEGRYRAAALLVEQSKSRLRAYYARLGFAFDRAMTAFGSLYDKMLLKF